MENTTDQVKQSENEKDTAITQCVNTILETDTHMVINSRIVQGINAFMSDSKEIFQLYDTGSADDSINTLSIDIHRLFGVLKGSKSLENSNRSISITRDLYEHYMELNRWIKIHRPELLECELDACAEKQDFIMDYTPVERGYYSNYVSAVIERYLALYQVQYTRLSEIDQYVRMICEKIKAL